MGNLLSPELANVAGDKSSVTVMGHGTGAACLHYLMTSDALPHGESEKYLIIKQKIFKTDLCLLT